MGSNHSAGKFASELAGIFTDPVICHPGGWGDSLPAWLKEAITVERTIEMAVSSQTGLPVGTDAEACAYLCTASSCFPLRDPWYNVYLYVATKTYEHHRGSKSGVKMPDDVRVDELSDYEKRELDRLKHWIYDVRLRHRQEKLRGLKKEEREVAAPAPRKSNSDQMAFQF